MGLSHDGCALAAKKANLFKEGKTEKVACVCVSKWIGKQQEENVTREQPRVSDVTAL